MYGYRIKSKFVYPMWFTPRDSEMVVKFMALHTGVVIATDVFESTWAIGDTVNPLSRHTDITMWTQVDEPIEMITVYETMYKINGEWLISAVLRLEEGILSNETKTGRTLQVPRQ